MTGRSRPTTEMAGGETLHRVHAAGRDARFYGRRDQTSRWDDPDRGFGVLYLGTTQEAAFAETLLRKPSQRAIVWNEVDKRRLARFRATEPLHLADFHGKGRGWEGVTVAEIAADHDNKICPDAYAKNQTISAAVHSTTDLDGIAYRSRLNPDQICVALFDRADHKIELVEEGETIERNWIDDLLEPYGKYVVDL